MLRESLLVPLVLEGLRSEDGEAVLRIIARGSLAEGMERSAVVEAFEEARSVLQTEKRDADEERLLDVLDALSGWAPPGRNF